MDKIDNSTEMISEIVSNSRYSIDLLLENIDVLRLEAYRKLDPKKRAQLGQFSTSSSMAQLMASMFSKEFQNISLLDAGAGIGSLSSAFVTGACYGIRKPGSIKVTAYEIEPTLIEYLSATLLQCREICKNECIEFSFDIFDRDFIKDGVEMLDESYNSINRSRFNCIILNPPYRKIKSKSIERRLLKRIGVETSNLYAAFLWLAIELLEPGGELVAVTPRSFCNGPYFKAFRNAFFKSMTLHRIHAFESRTGAFHEDNILQEIIIIHAVKSIEKGQKVITSSSYGPQDACINMIKIDHDQLVHPNDPYAVINIIPNEKAYLIRQQMENLGASLNDLNLAVSTGRVVDFRARERGLLRNELTKETVPLIYPAHFSDGFIKWPFQKYKKPDAIIGTNESEDLLVPSGFYVLVKRFSSKEEPRRIMAAVYNPDHISASTVGFENHLNYFHQYGKGIPPELAKGLAVFLNSTLVDQYFRQFSGHTQVNVADLKSLKYPSKEKLVLLGSRVDGKLPQQEDLDYLVNEILIIVKN